MGCHWNFMSKMLNKFSKTTSYRRLIVPPLFTPTETLLPKHQSVKSKVFTNLIDP